MLRLVVLTALAASLPMGGGYNALPAPPPPARPAQVDILHSNAQLITDATTDFGKTKINYTAGYARVNGEVTIDAANPANSKFDLHMYPANAKEPTIEEQGESRNKWMADMPSHTLICFHSTQVTRMPDGKLQVTGDLVLTRVDRNVNVEPSEAYSGPTYGAPMVHRVVRQATFVFDAPTWGPRDSRVTMGSTSVSRENFPQLVKAVLSTHWPPVIEGETCTNPAGGTEDYRGFECKGVYLRSSGLPPPPTSAAEDYPGASDFNRIVGNQMTIVLHLRLNRRRVNEAGEM